MLRQPAHRWRSVQVCNKHAERKMLTRKLAEGVRYSFIQSIVTKRWRHRIEICCNRIESHGNRFQNARTRQKQHGILCWRLLGWLTKLLVHVTLKKERKRSSSKHTRGPLKGDLLKSFSGKIDRISMKYEGLALERHHHYIKWLQFDDPWRGFVGFVVQCLMSFMK